MNKIVDMIKVNDVDCFRDNAHMHKTFKTSSSAKEYIKRIVML